MCFSKIKTCMSCKEPIHWDEELIVRCEFYVNYVNFAVNSIDDIKKCKIEIDRRTREIFSIFCFEKVCRGLCCKPDFNFFCDRCLSTCINPQDNTEIICSNPRILHHYYTYKNNYYKLW